MGMAPPGEPGRTDGRKDSPGNEPWSYEELRNIQQEASRLNGEFSEAALELMDSLTKIPFKKQQRGAVLMTVCEPLDCIRQAKADLEFLSKAIQDVHTLAARLEEILWTFRDGHRGDVDDYLHFNREALLDHLRGIQERYGAWGPIGDFQGDPLREKKT